MIRRLVPLVLAIAAPLGAPISAQQVVPASDPHAEHAMHAPVAAKAAKAVKGARRPAGGRLQDVVIPAGAADVVARLAKSPRHNEYVKIATGITPTDSIAAWVVYPERRDNAPVVVVIHEIFGLTNWIHGVADQLAADGFIAIAPDLMTGKISPATPDSAPQLATQTIRTLDPAVVQKQLQAIGNYGLSLPAAKKGKYGVVGFCWGGSTSFMHSVANPDLGAAVVYYGTSPSNADIAKIKAPVLGLYGEMDARVNATIDPADSSMKAGHQIYDWQKYAGAGHGFLRGQDQMNGANLEAAKLAWPRTLGWFRKYLGR
jgi:carboxymethylenebutenolidase